MSELWTPMVITWRDAYSPSGTRTKDFIKHKIEPCIRRSIGFVLRDDEENVIICMEDDRETVDVVEGDSDCENVTVIPRGLIVKVEELTIRRAPRRLGEPEQEA
jgi:hypothetical protein